MLTERNIENFGEYSARARMSAVCYNENHSAGKEQGACRAALWTSYSPIGVVHLWRTATMSIRDHVAIDTRSRRIQQVVATAMGTLNLTFRPENSAYDRSRLEF